MYTKTLLFVALLAFSAFADISGPQEPPRGRNRDIDIQACFEAIEPMIDTIVEYKDKLDLSNPDDLEKPANIALIVLMIEDLKPGIEKCGFNIDDGHSGHYGVSHLSC